MPTGDWENARTGVTRIVPWGIDPGFDHHPGVLAFDEAVQATGRDKIQQMRDAGAPPVVDRVATTELAPPAPVPPVEIVTQLIGPAEYARFAAELPARAVALRLYTIYNSPGAEPVNRLLRTGEGDPDLRGIIDVQKQALAALPAYEGDVQRREDMTDERLAQHAPQNEVLFAPGTRFFVRSKVLLPDGGAVIEMEETTAADETRIEGGPAEGGAPEANAAVAAPSISRDDLIRDFIADGLSNRPDDDTPEARNLALKWTDTAIIIPPPPKAP